MATIAPTAFLQQVRQEMAKVVWPTRQETLKLTVVVIAVSAGIGLFIGALDIVFVRLNQLLIG